MFEVIPFGDGYQVVHTPSGCLVASSKWAFVLKNDAMLFAKACSSALLPMDICFVDGRWVATKYARSTCLIELRKITGWSGATSEAR